MRKVFWLFLIFLFVSFTYAEKVATFKEILKPRSFTVDDNQIYIKNEFTIYIYSLSDFKLIKKFGSKGEGPGEFLFFLNIFPQKDRLLVNSWRKVSYFTRDGVLLKEQKKSPGVVACFTIYPLRDKFVGTEIIRKEKDIYRGIYFYNSQFAKEKEIYRVKAHRLGKGKFYFPPRDILRFRVYKNRIYIAANDEFRVLGYDYTGKQVLNIHRDYEKRKVTENDIEKIKEWLKIIYKEQYDFRIKSVAFPSHFPDIRQIYLDNDKLYIATFKRDIVKFSVLGLCRMLDSIYKFNILQDQLYEV